MTTRRLPAGAQPVRMPQRRGLPSTANPPEPAPRPRVAAAAAPPDAGRIVLASDTDARTSVGLLLWAAGRNVRAQRAGQNIHVSDLLGGRCIRRRALLTLTDRPVPAVSLTLSDELTFAQGDALHDKIREIFIRGARSDRAGRNPMRPWGNWACLCGRTRTDTPSLQPAASRMHCEHCERPLDEYQEIDLYDEELTVVGHPDFLLKDSATGAISVLEVKSISALQYPSLEAAQPDHIAQAVLYWDLLKRAGQTVCSHVYIVYINKGAMFQGSPVKIFRVDAINATQTIEAHWDNARAIRDAIAGRGPLPDRPCSATTDTTAKNCPVMRQCFDQTGQPARGRVISIRDAQRG